MKITLTIWFEEARLNSIFDAIKNMLNMPTVRLEGMHVQDYPDEKNYGHECGENDR